MKKDIRTAEAKLELVSRFLQYAHVADASLEDNELKCPHNGVVKLKSNKGKSFKSKDILNKSIINHIVESYLSESKEVV